MLMNRKAVRNDFETRQAQCHELAVEVHKTRQAHNNYRRQAAKCIENDAERAAEIRKCDEEDAAIKASIDRYSEVD